MAKGKGAKGINATSGAQFAALPLVKPVACLRAPLSTDVPVLLLNQTNNLFKGTDLIENEVEPVRRLIFIIISRYGIY